MHDSPSSIQPQSLAQLSPQYVQYTYPVSLSRHCDNAGDTDSSPCVQLLKRFYPFLVGATFHFWQNSQRYLVERRDGLPSQFQAI